ncbi:MAG: mechanosensitive ion channel [Alphaproteobacteria bacterium]|nr:mechanosensitive ion channel [Alphaproteobacteria bacterium]
MTQLATTYARRRAARNVGLSSALFLIRWAIRTIVWSVAFLFLLDNLGVNVSALIAGLGVGGIALGLASPGVIRDLLGSLSVILDRPFVIAISLSWATYRAQSRTSA